MDLKRYQDLKTTLQDVQKREERATGIIQHILDKLQSEHGCDLEQARKLIKKMNKRLESREQTYEQLLQECVEKWLPKLREF